METSIKRFKILSSFNILIENILSDTIKYLTSRFNQSKTVFTAASPFGQLLLVIENISQLIFYYIEDAITELNINEATRNTSIYSLASLAGHNPSRAVSAVGEISISTNSEAFNAPSDTVIIPNLTRIKCLNNGLTYILDLPQDEIKFSFSGKDNGMKIQIRQGNIETQTVISRGIPTQSFSIGSPQNFFIDNFFVNVYVNGEKWKKYESILDIPRLEKGFIAKTGITSGLDIYFGNNNFGAIPPSGSKIDVEYLVTDGSAGNIRTNDPSKVVFQFIDTGFTMLGDEINLNDYIEITCTNPPYFGANPEDSKLTKLIAPNTSKSFALVNASHYEIVLRKLKMFSVINVFLDENDDRILNLFLIPDIRKTFSVGQDYFGADINRFIMSEYQKKQLLSYIEKSGTKLISTDIRIIDPIISRYVINISIIAFDDIPIDIIKRDIYNSIGTYFIENTRRERIPKSDLIKIIEEINGVDTVSVSIISEKYENIKKRLVQESNLEDSEYKRLQNLNRPLTINEISTININPRDLGTDEFNDIIIREYELPIIRGGFTDRYGNYYSEGISEESLGAVNIQIKNIVPRPKIK